MHIVIISACEKRAIKKTRAVLDSYAIRTGDMSWASPITTEGMREMRSALKRCATRQTAVACYRNEGRRSMKLLWIVGSKRPFGTDGHFPCGFIRVRKDKEELPHWVRLASLLASASGLAHDTGKAGTLFQDKLARALQNSFLKEADPVRHEWVSMRLMQEMRTGKTMQQAWEKIKNPKYLQELSLKNGLSGVFDVLDFLIVSHHRLFGPETGLAVPSIRRHIRDERAEILPSGLLTSLWGGVYSATLTRIGNMVEEHPAAYWRGLAIWTRVALIFADHLVSAREVGDYGHEDGCLYAKTTRLGNGKCTYGQPLFWHLEHVAQEAAKTAYRLATLRLPTLSDEAVERILEASYHGRFVWQNRASDALRGIRQKSEAPVLVFNVASTGAGKTRMNAKCACILGTAGRFRFAVALNQRTLTLQTGDALSLQLGIGKDEMAIVIGDRVASQLHEVGHKGAESATDDDGIEIEAEFEIDTSSEGDGFVYELPDWLAHLADRKPFLPRILGAPVLVSTIDFLISAGELQRQGNHVSAMLRLLDSDIVLDEIDSYDPTAMMAVLRMIQMVGFSGRNLICSSATLAYPLAQAVHDAYRSGIEMRAQLHGLSPDFPVAIIDDLVSPTVIMGEGFEEGYRMHLGRMLAEMGKTTYRLPVLQKIPERSEPAWLDAVANAVILMHEINCWNFNGTAKTVSFGLVRVANIKTALRVARYLSERLPQAKIACYHSQDFVIQRFLKEQRLDALLNRKKGNGHIEADPEIAEIVRSSLSGSIPLIVVATPVEEIGRDHDFDWTVIEPSSSHSIVQTAGRVNRHRLMTVTHPNVAILQFNMNWAKGRQVCFCRPGLESGQLRYDSQNMAELLRWDDLEAGLDARLRFEGHRFAQLDDESISAALKEPLKGLCDLSGANTVWMTEGFYRDYPLRSGEPKQTWRVGKDEDGDDRFELLELVNYALRFVPKNDWVHTQERTSNDWLCFDTGELREYCVQFGISEEEGLRFEIVNYARNDPDTQGQLRIVFDKSFGLYLSSEKS
jgi:CRISPR-associated endonuclease/helicase Cas3